MHGHWVVPGGVIAARRPRRCRWSSACTARTCTSPSGSRRRAARRAAVFRRAGCVTACSDDLRAARDRARRGAGAHRRRARTASTRRRFRPDAAARATSRARSDSASPSTLDACGRRPAGAQEGLRVPDRRACARRCRTPCWRSPATAILRDELRAARADGRDADACASSATGRRTRSPRSSPPPTSSRAVGARRSGNVDGLPNIVLEALASGTPLVTTPAGGIGAVVEDGVDRGRSCRSATRRRSPPPCARLAGDRRCASGSAPPARRVVEARFGWDRTAERFEIGLPARACLRLYWPLTFDRLSMPALTQRISRPSRDDHRRPGLHRQQPRARAGRPRRRRPARRFADPRLRRQPVQHRRHRGSRCGSTSPTSASRAR